MHTQKTSEAVHQKSIPLSKLVVDENGQLKFSSGKEIVWQMLKDFPGIVLLVLAIKGSVLVLLFTQVSLRHQGIVHQNILHMLIHVYLLLICEVVAASVLVYLYYQTKDNPCFKSKT